MTTDYPELRVNIHLEDDEDFELSDLTQSLRDREDVLKTSDQELAKLYFARRNALAVKGTAVEPHTKKDPGNLVQRELLSKYIGIDSRVEIEQRVNNFARGRNPALKKHSSYSDLKIRELMGARTATPLKTCYSSDSILPRKKLISKENSNKRNVASNQEDDPLMVECVECRKWVVASTHKNNLAIGYCCSNILVSKIL